MIGQFGSVEYLNINFVMTPSADQLDATAPGLDDEKQLQFS
jgi:hypothetical protein